MQAVNMISNAYNWQIKGTTSKSSQQRRQLMMSATTMSTLSIARTTAKNNGDNEQTINSKNMHRKNRNTRFCLGVENMLLFVVLVLLSMTTTVTAGGQQIEAAAPTTSTRMQFSLPLTTMSGDLLNDDDNFRPIIPKDVNPEFISRNVFTKSGHYRVFQPLDGESDLRVAVAVKRKDYVNNVNDLERTNGKVQSSHKPAAALSITTARPVQLNMTEKTLSADKRKGHEYAKAGVPSNEIQGRKVKMTDDVLPKEMDEAVSRTAAQQQSTVLNAEVDSTAMHNELKGLEELLIDYVENFFSQGKYEPLPGLVLELQKNHTRVEQQENNGNKDKGNGNGTGSELKRHVRRALADTNVSVNLPRAMESGRLLFSVGVKKLLWPIYMGFQVLKSLLFALFLPTLIGSVSRLIGKGITSGSAGSVPLFVRPMDTPQDLDFRDNNFSFDDDGKFSMNTEDAKDNINQAASQTQSQYTPYNAATINQMALDRQHQHMMQDTYLSALQSIGAASFKNSQGISSGSSGGLGGGGMSAKKPASPANMNTFQTFQKVPATSLLLSNYDPFYSPLLSRLDSVFAQLKLNSENEHCREKLICLMYANPAKYAPYSNLVSAQLSRELNELRKPTSDNPDILRFFKYMRAAKDGQDGIDCEQSFAKCQEFKDFENPAMLSTYNDINKLVQARKFA